MLETLTTLFQPWADRYGDSSALSTTIVSLHVLSMFLGGGIAIGADRRVLLAMPGTAEAHRAVAEDLKAQHGIVVGSLVAIVLSGLLLATADIGTFAVSLVFWAKMGVFAALMINGLLMRRTEARVVNAAKNTTEFSVIGPDLSLPWDSLRRSAWVSLAGWFLTVLLGVVLTNN
jgi:uncharacterized membrane protein